ncbi:MAG: molybdenum cofactor guanylyltransferase [Bacillota bacterium]
MVSKGMKRLSLSAAVLAGGESKRMGENKAFLKLGGKRLIEIIVEELHHLFAEVIVVSDNPQELVYLPARLAGDIYREGEKNALRGIHAALSAAFHPSCFVVACDMPFLSLGLIEHMAAFALEYDLVAPRLDGHYQPLFSFYNKMGLPAITVALEQKQYKISSLFRKLRVKEIGEDVVNIYDPKQLSFLNINTREVLRYAEAYLNE